MKKFTKGISLIMTIFMTMAVLITGCGSSTNKDSTTSSAKSADSSTIAKSEPVTITFWSAASAFNIPSGIQTDPISKQIEKELNIKIDMETHPSDEKLAALLASNDLMDIMEVDKKYATQMQSLVADLTPLIDKNGPDIKTTVSPELMNYSKKYIGNGNLSFLPVNISDENALPDQVWGGVYTRWDYYKELGYPEIKSTDEYLDVVEQMLKKHPKNEEGKKNYGFSLWFDWGPYVQTNTMTSGNAGVVAYGGTSSVVEFDRDTIERKNIYLTPNSSFWQGVDFFYKANQKKLLDPESFTQKYEQAIQKMSTNQVLAATISFASAPAWTYFTSKGISDKGFFGPIPISGSKFYTISASKFGSNSVYAISKDSKHTDRAMELLNWFYSVHGAMTAQNGIEGTDWVKENGKYSYTDLHEKNIQDPEYYNKYGYRKFPNLLGISPNALIPGTRDPIDIGFSREVQKQAVNKPENAILKAAVDYYKVDIQSDILPKGIQYTKNPASDILGFLPVIAPDDIKLLDQKLDNYLKQAIPRIILSKDSADYETQKAKMMEELKGLGLEKVYAYWDNAFAKALIDMKAISEK